MHDVEVVKRQGRALTAAEFFKLIDIPPELEWFANLRNPKDLSYFAQKFIWAYLVVTNFLRH